MNVEDYSILSATEIASYVRSKAVSAVEITKAALSMIERRNAKLNAMTFVDADGALTRAAAIDAMIARGEDPGPLAGVPTSVKDLFGFYPGWPATLGGIRALKDNRATFKGYFPAAMEAAGAVLLGMSNSSLIGYNLACENFLYGPTANAFNPSLNSGGSSGGAAAAVAGGMMPIAGANDGGGSIRIPSAWSGLFGFQGSQGRVPIPLRPIAFDTISPFIYDGVVSRSVADTALSMSVLTQFDAADPFSIPDPVDWLAELDQPIAGLRIGYDIDLGGFPVEPAIKETITRAIGAFEELGAIVTPVEFKLPRPLSELVAAWRRLVGIRMSRQFAMMKDEGLDLLKDHRDDLLDAVVEDIEIARRMSLADVQRDLAIRTEIFDAFNSVFADTDLLVSATMGALPTANKPNGLSAGPARIAGQDVNPLFGAILTFFTNLTGHPAASIPAGLVDGLPVGMQIIGRPRGDRTVIRVASAFERARPWGAAHRAIIDQALA